MEAGWRLSRSDETKDTSAAVEFALNSGCCYRADGTETNSSTLLQDHMVKTKRDLPTKHNKSPAISAECAKASRKKKLDADRLSHRKGKKSESYDKRRKSPHLNVSIPSPHAEDYIRVRTSANDGGERGGKYVKIGKGVSSSSDK